MNDRGEQTKLAMREGQATPGPFGRLRSLAAGLAIVVAALGLGFPGSGCLNPRPEELPSGANGEAERPAEVLRETCEDNPLLAGCALPETDVNADDIGNDESDAPPADPEPPLNLGGAGASDDGGGDAGVSAADAGAL